MRVSLATQIFSKSVAHGLQYYLKAEEKNNSNINEFEGCEATINFSLRINDMFDTLNRSYPHEGIREGSKDFQILQESIEWLDAWEKQQKIKDLFLTKSTAEALRVTLYSTIHLTNYLLKSCGFLYVLTNKMK
ncbi:uncharacterized protein LOC131667733 [Phymastichus coffea]|uniref:uncharacterized protein LOC131667733 n=1 Tax=Phymastichus coffea TaxID=108790 RepID=UPI00273BB054|nr:uncharacterized protein LOC131667733 [Phymastichus coffea]